jgi:hypothetical protein
VRFPYQMLRAKGSEFAFVSLFGVHETIFELELQPVSAVPIPKRKFQSKQKIHHALSSVSNSQRRD